MEWFLSLQFRPPFRIFLFCHLILQSFCCKIINFLVEDISTERYNNRHSLWSKIKSLLFNIFRWTTENRKKWRYKRETRIQFSTLFIWKLILLILLILKFLSFMRSFFYIKTYNTIYFWISDKNLNAYCLSCFPVWSLFRISTFTTIFISYPKEILCFCMM